MKKCAICNTPITREDAPILTMGAYGTPKCLCDECDAELAVATEDRDYKEAFAAIERIGRKVADSSVADRESLVTVKEILSSASERARRIRLGEYDFSEDGISDAIEEIPEELLESDEDRELDRADEEKNKRFDRIFNWVAGFVIGAAAAFLIYRVLDTYIF